MGVSDARQSHCCSPCSDLRQAVAPVKRVDAGSANSLTPSVTGIVKKLEVHVTASGALEQTGH